MLTYWPPANNVNTKLAYLPVDVISEASNQIPIMQLVQPQHPRALHVRMESIRAHTAMQNATNQPEPRGERRPGCHHQSRSSAEDYPATSLRGVIISPAVSRLIMMRPSQSPLQSGRPRTFVCLGLRACVALSNSIGRRQEIRAAVLACFQGRSERDAERGRSDEEGRKR